MVDEGYDLMNSVHENKLFWDICQNTLDKYSNKPAIVDQNGKQVFTYKEFFDYAFSISSTLINKGVNLNDFVLCELPVCPELFAARMGIWMAGATLISYAPGTPEKITQKTKDKFNVEATINDDFIKSLNKKSENLESFSKDKIRNGDNAFVVFTSGSTGEPKEILHSFKSFYHIVKRYLKLIELNPDHKHGCYSNPTFIASIIHDSFPLMIGQTVQVIPEKVKKDVKELSNFIHKNKINNLYVFPYLVDYLDKSKLESVKNIFVGGSKCPPIHSYDFTITNFYGLSETGLIASYHIKSKRNPVPIGNCPGNGKIYLIDGEICFAGHFSEPYLNNKEEAEKKYVDNPFYEKDGFKHLFKTGDIAEQLPDGNILYLNRNDFMVELNGQRVEPDQINQTVKKLDGIHDAFVKTFTNGSFGYLCCFYVSDNEISNKEFKEILFDKLPDYMIPSKFIKLDEIPRNPNGKVDYKALIEPVTKKVKPTNSTQQELCEILQEILNIPEIGIDENIFDLGASSLEIIVICAKLNGRYNITLTNSDIVNNPCVKDIEKIISDCPENVFYNYQNTCDDPKMTFVYPAGAGGGSYADLFEHIKDNCNFTCFDNFNLFRNKNRINGIENIAKFLIDKLDYTPKYLGGWCYGGLLAYEMACQMQNIDTVFMIDSRLIPKDKKPMLDSKIVKDLFMLDPHAKRFCDGGLIDKLVDNYLLEVDEIYNFKPKPYNGNVVLFKAMLPDPEEEHLFDTVQDSCNGFFEYAKQMTVIPIKACHSLLMDEKFAKIISDYMNRYWLQNR